MSTQRFVSTIFAVLLLSTIPLIADDDWCDRAGGGPPGSDIPVDLSAAHAGARFFGVQVEYSIADQALANAIDPPGALSTGAFSALQAYSESLVGVCVAPANTSTLGPAQVFTFGTIVLIRPGTGSVQISPNADLVVVDLRDLPAVPGLRAALDAAVAPALVNPVHRADRIVREHFGLKDEGVIQQSIYHTELIQQAQADIPASWSNRPAPTLALATGRRLAPEAAELAGTLRMAGRAWIVGDDVFASVAESRWRGIGTLQDTGSGLVYRVEDLLDPPHDRWPDVIPADILSSDPTGNLQDLRRILKGSGNPPHLNGGNALRPALQQVDPFNDRQPGGLRLGEIRGQLLVIHGAVRLFFPYFPVVGDNIDPRLVETLATLGSSAPVDPVLAVRVVRRFGEALRDGHNGWATFYPPANPFTGGLPVNLEQSGGEAIVRKSNIVELQTGDTLTSIGGLSTADWFAQEALLTSAATDGWRFNQSYQLGGLWRMLAPLEFGIRAPDGTTRTTTISPYTYSNFGGLFARPYSFRSEGPLTDLGSPDLYYINLSSAVLGNNMSRFDAAVDDAKARGAAGLILDLRQPKDVNLDHPRMNQRLICSHFSSMTFNIPVWSGPDVRTVNSSHYERDPVNPYCGPIVLMVSSQILSNNEDMAAQLVGAHRVTVVGRRSGGTNGNITTVLLPGNGITVFTGMEVLNVDGSQFHGIGIVPQYEVNYTAQDFVDGRDRDMEVALQVLHGQTP